MPALLLLRSNAQTETHDEKECQTWAWEICHGNNGRTAAAQKTENIPTLATAWRL